MLYVRRAKLEAILARDDQDTAVADVTKTPSNPAASDCLVVIYAEDRGVMGRRYLLDSGVSRIGRMPEMVQAGINVSIGTDGNNASNYSDLHRATYLVAGLFKDGRQDPQMFPAEMAYEMATLGGARTMLMQDQIGSLEVGKKADVVLHDTDRPEWRPLLNVINQLVWSADGRSVHSVWVDGRQVVDDGRMTTIDESALYAAAQSAGEAITIRSGLPDKAKFPTW